MDTSYPLAKGRVAGVRKEFDEAFGSADISVQMVLFRVDPSEEKTAKEQFEESLKKMKTPSHLWEAKNPEDLAVALEAAFRPRVRLLDNGKPVDKASVPEAGLSANRERDDLLRLVPSGLIKPGSFEAVVSGSEPQAMKLGRGDRLLVRLLSDAQERVVYRRDLFANEFRFLSDRRKDEGEWVLCVPQLTDELTSFFTRLRLMATVETTRGQIPTRKGILQQSPPAYVLWEVVPGGPDEPKMGQMRVESLPGYPAPAWRVVVDDWPALPVRPVRLTAYVGRELPSGKPLPVPIDRVLAGGFSVKDAKVDGHDVSVSVSYEEQPLRTAANQTDEPPRVPCLVVRVTHPLNQPVTVHLARAKTIGEEHRFYKAAGAYTGLFGPLTREELAGLKLELSLLSLAELKAAATPIRIDMIPRAENWRRKRSTRFGAKKANSLAFEPIANRGSEGRPWLNGPTESVGEKMPMPAPPLADRAACGVPSHFVACSRRRAASSRFGSGLKCLPQCGSSPCPSPNTATPIGRRIPGRRTMAKPCSRAFPKASREEISKSTIASSGSSNRSKPKSADPSCCTSPLWPSRTMESSISFSAMKSAVSLSPGCR